MPSLQSRESRLSSATLLVGVGLALAACGSSGGSPSPGPASHSVSAQRDTQSASPVTSSGAEPTTGAGATTAIEANWAKFFDAKTPTSQRIALLQNGSVFAPVIKAQAGSPLAQLATSKVSKVNLTGTTQASVVYAILVSGKPALSNLSGVAVYQSGVWKVGQVSFCSLLKLENGGKTTGSGYPAACKG